MASSKPLVCVVGSSNVDLICYCERLPVRGETIHGNKFEMGFGGKGANQCVMAAKLGATARMVTKVGSDEFGRQTVENYESQGVSTQHVSVVEGLATGVAPITVDAAGNNSIVIVSGANGTLCPQDVRQAREAIVESDVVLCQNETPADASLEAFRIARLSGTVTVLNPAPAPTADAPLPKDLFALTDIICPNETETEAICGQNVDSIEAATQAALFMLEKKMGTVVMMTLGERGVLLAAHPPSASAPIADVISAPVLAAEEVVDTTGAGDSFLGAFGFFLSRVRRQRAGLKNRKDPQENFWSFIDLPSLKDVVRRACYVATESIKRPGTQKSYPLAKDLPKDIMEPAVGTGARK